MEPRKEKKRPKLVAALIDTFGFSPAVASTVATLLVLLCLISIGWIIQSAPPRKLTITTGPEGSSYHRWARAYQKALEKHGVTLDILTSNGSRENLQRLQDKASKVDIGFVQSGLTKDEDISGLVSLGSVANQPLWIYYRSDTPVTRLSQFAGKRIAIGPQGSGARMIATTLLQANGIKGEPTVFLDIDAAAAASGLLEGSVDVAFFMGDSASTQTLRGLSRVPGVQMFNFTQAAAYSRRYAFLNLIEIPQGSFDLGLNVPAEDTLLVGPTVELVAKSGLHSALSDLLLGIAKDVHGRASLMQKRGEFPAPLEQELPLSEDALRYYESGKSFLYRTIDSFWVASLLNRILVAVVPLILVIVPALKLLPLAYRLTILLRLYRCYRPLLRVERETYGPLSPERIEELRERLDEVEFNANKLKVPASFGDRLYWLRSHLAFVRQRLSAIAEGKVPAPRGA
ncbi:MAG: ABC transporter substrate-binding protein [Opitutus sp.]|nr:ABC transporter substrate-binding protein [Opitutus sp.]